MTQFKKKKRQAISGKNDYSVRHFTLVLTIYRSTKKQRKKSSQDVPVNLSENIPTKTETMTHKSPTYLLGILSHIENFTITINESPN